MSTTPAPTSWLRSTPTRPIKPAGLTEAFLKNPLLFMRVHSMSPPNESGWMGDKGTHAGGVRPTPPPAPKTGWQSAQPSQKPKPWVPATPSKLNLLGAHERPDKDVERLSGAGGIRHVQIIQHTSPNFAGATSFKFSPENGSRPDGSFLPIYWLPWQSLKIKSYQIPDVPHDLAEWDDEEYPRFFFTAGINGCSVFAQGNPQNPTISHAGIDGTLGRPAGEFWRAQMAKTKSGYGNEKIRGEVNASDYSNGSEAAKRAGRAYADFLNTGTTDFRMEMQSPFGCVFGIRYGRSWTLYLQKSVLFNKLRFYKSKDVETIQVYSQQREVLKGTQTAVKIHSTTQVSNKLGPVPLPGKKDVQVYCTSQQISLPLEVIEMYPNKKVIGDLKELFKVT